ncbi:MAG: FkbM family methyltransferase [Phycisphaerae bacterium]
MRKLKELGLWYDQVRGFARETCTPWLLTADLLRLRRKPYVARMRNGLRLTIRPRTGERYALYENMVRRDYLRHGAAIGPGSTVIDIGANIGTFALTAATIVGPKGRVICLEPEPATYRILVDNIRTNQLSHVTPVNAAVAARAGTVLLNVSNVSIYHSTCVAAEQLPGAHQSVTVPAITIEGMLDEYGLDAVDLLKVDCEGAEYEMFENMSAATAKRIRQIAMEVHNLPGRSPSQLIERLAELGFAVTPTIPLYARRNLPTVQNHEP